MTALDSLRRDAERRGFRVDVRPHADGTSTIALVDPYGDVATGCACDNCALQLRRRLEHFYPQVRRCGAPASHGDVCGNSAIGPDGLCVHHRRKALHSDEHAVYARLKALELAPVYERQPA